MLKMPITYQTLDGVEITEDFYFNLNIAEVAEMNEEFPGGLEAYLKTIIEFNNVGMAIGAFKKIMEKAYGVRSTDGKRFIKSPELWQEFTETDAFGRLFFELLTDAEKNADFIVKCLPGDFQEKMAKLQAAQEQRENHQVTDKSKELEDYTKEELLNMPVDEFDQLIKKNKGSVPIHVLQVAMQRKTNRP